MSARVVVLIGAALIVAGAAVGYALWPAGQPDRGPADLAMGAQLYAENCASCHGAALEGEANWRTPSPYCLVWRTGSGYS